MKLIRANIQDAENLWKMQIVAFQDLYAKYQDPETSPATETLEKTMTRLEQPYNVTSHFNSLFSSPNLFHRVPQRTNAYQLLRHLTNEISHFGLRGTQEVQKQA